MENTFEGVLEQHSPIIHFQWNQSGATLRATEVKPKLDKFIIKEKFKNDFNNYKKFVIGFNQNQYDDLTSDKKEKYIETLPKALNYKVGFSSEIDRCENYTIISESKKGLKLKKIKFSFFSYHTELLDIIKNSLKEFFVLNNFGNRKSKGFGSFTYNIENKKDFEEILKRKYKLIFRKEIIINEIRKKIDNEYKILKSGSSGRSGQKSKLYEYMKQKEIFWEKEKIRGELKKNHSDVFNNLAGTSNVGEFNENKNYKYVRGLLGLAEHNEYRTKNGSKFKKITILIKNDKEKDKEKIDRFQSPITFKIFKNLVYILPEKIPEKMMDRNFRFKIKETDKELFDILTPEKFDLEDFLKKSLNGWHSIRSDV